jgi:hypothetical protein
MLISGRVFNILLIYWITYIRDVSEARPLYVFMKLERICTIQSMLDETYKYLQSRRRVLSYFKLEKCVLRGHGFRTCRTCATQEGHLFNDTLCLY